MDTFRVGTTIICDILVKDDDGALQDAATTMKIKIDKNDGNFEVILALTNMDNDSTGTYHYDFQTAGKDRGQYIILYVATDGSRLSYEPALFKLV